MDIDSNCPYLLPVRVFGMDSNCPYLLPVFGETTSHLTTVTSKLNVMDGRTDRWTDGQTGGFLFFFNVENSIKREIRKNCFS